MKNKHFLDKIVKVSDEVLTSRRTSWDSYYDLYKEAGFGNRYFMDGDDCSDSVSEIYAYSDDEAIQKFNEVMDALEDGDERYHIIDKSERNVRAELKELTFREVKNFFEPDKELAEYHERWEKINDLYDLREYLEYDADGIEVNYEIVLA